MDFCSGESLFGGGVFHDACFSNKYCMKLKKCGPHPEAIT